MSDNQDRADRAALVLNLYPHPDRDELNDWELAVDLFTDLMHYLDRTATERDVNALVGLATINFEAERDDEQGPDDDGQPDDAQELSDFAHDGEWDNMSAADVL